MDNIKLVCFDLDETLTTEPSWYNLNMALGVTHDEDRNLFNNYYHHKTISYEEWVIALIEIFKNRGLATRARITQTLSVFKYRPGAKDIVKYLKAKNYHIALISGAADIHVDLVAKDLGIELAESNNRLIFDANDYLENIVNSGDDIIVKLNYLESFCLKLGIKITECVCIGDGLNDIEMFRKTKHGITFPGSTIEKEAWKIINHFEDLKQIL